MTKSNELEQAVSFTSLISHNFYQNIYSRWSLTFRATYLLLKTSYCCKCTVDHGFSVFSHLLCQFLFNLSDFLQMHQY